MNRRFWVFVVGLLFCVPVAMTAGSLRSASDLAQSASYSGMSKPDARFISQGGSTMTDVIASASADASRQGGPGPVQRSYGCSSGCSSGCSVGCSTGCSNRCSVGCSTGCSVGCERHPDAF